MRKQLISFIFIIISLGLVSARSVSAQDIKLGIYPGIIEITTRPGTVIREGLVVFSHPGSNLDIHAELFKPDGFYGHVETYVPEGLNNNENPLNWISFSSETVAIPTRLDTAGRAGAQVIFEIDVPQNAPVGEYYFTIFASEANAINSENTSLNHVSGRIGANVLITVAGENYKPDYSLEITEFSGAGLKFQSPFELRVLVKNTGDARTKTTGTISISPFGGLFTGTRSKVNLLPLNIIPNSSRYLLTDIESDVIKLESPLNVFWDNFPNVHKVEVELDIEGDASTLKESSMIFYIPKRFLVLLGLIAILVGLRSFFKSQVAKNG